jgi:hypothetical protein
MTLEIKINSGSWASVETDGWQVSPLRRNSLAPDEVTLTRVKASFDEAAGIAYGDTVRLRLDGTVIFQGTAMAPQTAANDQSITVSVQVLGPWWHLTRLHYVRYSPWVDEGMPPTLGSTLTISGPGDYWNGTAWVPIPPGGLTYKWARQVNTGATPVELDLGTVLSSRGLILDPDYSLGVRYRTIKEDLRTLGRYALASYTHRAATAPFAIDLDDLEDGVGTDAAPRFRTWQDRSVADLMKDLLAARPDVVSWWDYSVDPPAFRVAGSSVQDTVSLTAGTAPLAGWSLTPRPDLKPVGVIVGYTFAPFTDNASRGYAPNAYLDKYPATTLHTDPGVLIFSIPPDASTVIQSGVAQAYYDALSTLRGEGSIQLAGFDTDLDCAAWRPGKKLSGISGVPELTGVELIIQSTTWDLQGRTVSVQVGLPRQLDLDTIRDLRGWLTMSAGGWPWDFQHILPAPP